MIAAIPRRPSTMWYVIVYLAATLGAGVVVSYCRAGSAMGFSLGIPIRSLWLGFPFYFAALLLGCAIICVASYKLRDDARAGRILAANGGQVCEMSACPGISTGVWDK